MADNVYVKDDTLVVESNGSAVPIVVSVNDGVCSVSAMATNGKPIAAIKVIDKETGTEVPVNIFTCTEAVVCNAGIPMQVHLQNLYGHTEDAEAHFAAGEKQNIETKEGAQAKATAAKTEAITASSLEIAAAKTEAAEDATTKANAARDAAYKYADKVGVALSNHNADNNNPHNVTAAQVGLGNVPNKATNDLQPTYSNASILTALSSGERLAVAFGKIAKAIADLIAHIGNKANPHGVTAMQVGAAPAIESTEYPGCYYRMVDGKTEWINPPMVISKEYRTTERHNGKSVYVKSVELDLSLTEDRYVYIDRDITSVVSIEGMIVEANDNRKPISQYSGEFVINIYGNLIANGGATFGTACCTVKYTK